MDLDLIGIAAGMVPSSHSQVDGWALSTKILVKRAPLQSRRLSLAQAKLYLHVKWHRARQSAEVLKWTGADVVTPAIRGCFHSVIAEESNRLASMLGVPTSTKRNEPSLRRLGRKINRTEIT